MTLSFTRWCRDIIQVRCEKFIVLYSKFFQDNVGTNFCRNRPSFLENIQKTFWLTFFLGHSVYVIRYHCLSVCVCSLFTVTVVVDMMPNHKKSPAGDKIEEVLRSTLRVLCSNAIPYGSEISIDALIGITVDSSEVILVNVHEQLDKSGNQLSGSNLNFRDYNSHVKSEPYDSTLSASVSQVKSELYDSTLSASVSHQQSYTATAAHSSDYSAAASRAAGYGSCEQPFGDIISIPECDDEDDDELGYDENCDMEEGDYNLDSFPDDPAAEFGDEYLTNFDVGNTGGDDVAAGSVYGHDVKPFKSKVGGYYQMRETATVASPRGRKRRGSTQMVAGRGTGPKSGTAHRQQKDPVKQKVIEYGESGTPSSHSQSIAASEKITVYTCSVCGKMFRHATSFQRHKQQHEGVVFRCDLCGAVLCRRDVLNTHRRKCEAKLMQQSASQPFDSM